MAILHITFQLFLVNLVFCAQGPIVETPLGRIQGVYTEESRNFYGIKFGQAPVGPLRWAPPVAQPSWSPALYNATYIRPACPQTNCNQINPSSLCPTLISEDCLNLNVYTPLDATSSSGLTVMIYFHGGNFVHMNGASVVFRGDVMVNKTGVIMVTTNYRLGALGYLVTDGAGDRARGNYGIQDQRLMMEWVRDNIRAFGGDPQQVTLVGQSAGAQSISIHMMSERSDPLFRYAIMQSHPLTLPMKFFNHAVQLGQNLATAVGCSHGDMTCLRARTWQELGQGEWAVRETPVSSTVLETFEPWGPYIDGDEVAAHPIRAFENGEYQRKPYILGTTDEEGHIYIYGAFPDRMNVFTYVGFLATVFGLQSTSVMGKYSMFEFADMRTQVARMATDWVFACPNRFVARKAAEQNRPVWLYVFDHVFSFPGWEDMTYCDGRACHAVDIVYMFQSAKFGGHEMSPSGLRVSNSYMTYLTNFAKYGNPNSPSGDTGEVPWPQFQGSQFNTIEIADPNILVSRRKQEICNFWDGIGYEE